MGIGLGIKGSIRCFKFLYFFLLNTQFNTQGNENLDLIFVTKTALHFVKKIVESWKIANLSEP